MKIYLRLPILCISLRVGTSTVLKNKPIITVWMSISHLSILHALSAQRKLFQFYRKVLLQRHLWRNCWLFISVSFYTKSRRISLKLSSHGIVVNKKCILHQTAWILDRPEHPEIFSQIVIKIDFACFLNVGSKWVFASGSPHIKNNLYSRPRYHMTLLQPIEHGSLQKLLNLQSNYTWYWFLPVL